MADTLTLEQIENRIEAQKAETEALINKRFEELPDVLQGAIQKAQTKAGMVRVPLASGTAPDGETHALWQTEDKSLTDRIRRGYNMGERPDAHLGFGQYFNTSSKARKAALIGDFYRYSPAAKAYSDDTQSGFDSFGAYLKAIYASKMGPGFRGIDPKLKASFGESGGDTGGFLVQPQYAMTLKALEIEGAQFEPMASSVPMNAMRLLMPTIRDTTHAAGGINNGISVYGGVAAAWAPEAGSFTADESEPQFGQVQLEAHKLLLYTIASNELIADSAIGLEAVIRQRFPDAAVWFKEDGFWTGDGGGMPEGVLNCAALYSNAKETGQAASTVVVENILKMYSHMLPTSHKRAAWFCHPGVLPQLGTMALSVGTGGAPIFINPYNGGVQNDFPYTIFGRPLYVSEHLPALGTAGALVYVDLSYYLIGTRQDLSFEASPHVRFTQDQTVWRMIERLDGKPWIDSALTLRDGSFQVSPFVALAA